jgi:myo-inositol-1(or 4)-monophosphatase
VPEPEFDRPASIATDVAITAELGRLAIELAVGAGRRARQWRRAGFTVEAKSTPTDLVTELDRAVEKWIAAEITTRRPGDGLVGEEGTRATRNGRVRWLIDPIDGTVNFAMGLPLYAVSVAAELDGRVVCGCVHNPESGEVFHATLGGGAYLARDRTEVAIDAEPPGTGVRLSGPRTVPLDRALVATGFAYSAATRRRQGAVAAALLPAIADIRRLGSASLDLCQVAAGRIDAYFEAGLNSWDFSAGLLIATEAGCVSSGLRGRPAGERFCAVAGPSLAEALFGRLSELNADILSDPGGF